MENSARSLKNRRTTSSRYIPCIIYRFIAVSFRYKKIKKFLHSSCRQFITHEKCGHSLVSGFIFKNSNKNIRGRKKSLGPFRIYQLISTANSALFEWNWAWLHSDSKCPISFVISKKVKVTEKQDRRYSDPKARNGSKTKKIKIRRIPKIS